MSEYYHAIVNFMLVSQAIKCTKCVQIKPGSKQILSLLWLLNIGSVSVPQYVTVTNNAAQLPCYWSIIEFRQTLGKNTPKIASWYLNIQQNIRKERLPYHKFVAICKSYRIEYDWYKNLVSMSKLPAATLRLLTRVSFPGWH